MGSLEASVRREADAPPSVHDLTQVVVSKALESRTTFGIAGIWGLGVLCILTSLLFLPLVLPFDWTNPWFLEGALGMAAIGGLGLACFLLAGRGFSAPARELRLDDEGMTLVYPHGAPRTLRWDRPNFRFVVTLFWTDGPQELRAYEVPLYFHSRAYLNNAAWDALLDRAKAHGLTLGGASGMNETAGDRVEISRPRRPRT